MPGLGNPKPEQYHKDQGCQCNTGIRDNHHHPAAPAVHQGTGKRSQEHRGQNRHQGGSRQHGSGTGLFCQPPNEGKLNK